MGLPHVRWSMCALWVALALVTFSFAETWSVRNWMVLIAASAIPPVILLRLWNEGPPQTVAEIIRATEDRQWHR